MHRTPALARHVALAAALALTVAACGGSDDAADTTEATADTGDTTDTTETDDDDTTDDSTDDSTETPDTTIESATTSTPATVPPTTGTPDTAPDTAPETAPDTSAVTPTSAVDDDPSPGDDMELAQFCFDSEQVYVFNEVVNVLTAPTPEQAEAALSILAFTIDAAIESAPDGMETEPQQMADVIARIDDAFAAYDYDVVAFGESPEAAELDLLFLDYEQLVGQLTDFVDAQCTSASAVLDSQAIKLAPRIEQLRDLPLQPIANQAGDIRLFVPVDWPEWIGTTDVEDVTFLEASDDIEQFENTWNVPGVLATVAYVGEGDAMPTTLLASSSAGPDCTLDATEPYEDPVYVGELHLLSDCAGVGTDAAVLAATDSATMSVEITLEFQFPGGYDRELLDQMLATFAAGA